MIILVRLWLCIIFPLLPLAFIIDILIGDIMTGVKDSPKEKVIFQWNFFKDTWNGGLQ